MLTVVTHAAQAHLKCHQGLGAEIVTIFKHIIIKIINSYIKKYIL